MNHLSCLELKHYSEEYLTVLNSFDLTEHQKQFTALPSTFAEVSEGQHRIVILKGNIPVGFFLLHTTERVKDYSDNPKALLLTAFSINHDQQGNGYAKKGMILLRDFVKAEFPEYNEIVLAVNHKNAAAQRLYSKAGFHDTGERRIGRIGEQYVMKLSL